MTGLGPPGAGRGDFAVRDVLAPEWWIALLQASFGASSRLGTVYLLSFVAMGYIIYRLRERQRSETFLAFLLPRHMYLHPSHFTDIKLFVAGRVLTVFGAFNFSALAALSATAVMVLLAQATGEGARSGEGSWIEFLCITFIAATVADFCTYWVHRLHHEVQVLWPFHKVHHSAEVLTPITAYRKHPVYDVFSAVAKAVPAGALQGLVLFLLVGKIEFVTLGGANFVYFAFNILGSNLRHSHIWLDFGPVFDRVFISPAQHQIHHSRAPIHFNKNYGEIFALWDWMFGSLYVPQGREAIEIGLADGTGAALPQPHPNFTQAMLEPFRESWMALRPHERVKA
jgi:sterol desaturase/sphingolipid hydroxylase (fatty acid hydroxylase superfamily)